MPARTRTVPRLCRDRQQAYVRIDGRRIQCGRWGTKEAQQAYDRVIQEWLAHDRRLPYSTAEDDAGGITVSRVALEYWRHAKRRHAGETRASIRRSLKRLRRLYSGEPVEAFGPKRLEVIRSSLVRDGYSRSTIAKYMRPILNAFKHAAAKELIDVALYRRLMVLEPLREIDLRTRTKGVKPVDLRDVARTRRHLPRPLRALIHLQLRTGARPGELVGLRATDLDTSGDVWTFRPELHKTAHHGRERIIYFGPRAQRIVAAFMDTGRSIDKPLFSPREANAEAKRRGARAGRRADQKPTPRQTGRVIRDAYDVEGYRRAIERACRKAGVTRWSPNQLRHNAATFLRREFGIEVARVILGHTTAATTEIYAEADHAKAIEVMRKIG